MTVGIYRIANTTNGNIYIGSSQNIEDRWAVHRSELRSGTHHSAYLQRSWDLHGADAFLFEIIEVVADIDLILAREQFWIDTCKPEYNLAPVAGSSRGRVVLPETRKKMSDAAKRRSMASVTAAAAKANKGRARPQSVKDKIAATKTAKRADYSYMTERNQDPVIRKKVSEARKGKVPWKAVNAAAAKRKARRIAL